MKQATSKITVGDPISYIVLISNSGTGPAGNATLVDMIPQSTHYVQNGIN